MRLRLGRKLWTVERVDAEALEGDFGECDYKNRVIRIRKGQSMEEFIDTLLHEGIHAQEPTWSEAKVSRRAKQLSSLLKAVMT